MTSKVIFKSEIKTNEKNINEIYSYFKYLNDNGLTSNIEFTQKKVESQISKKQEYIINPIVLDYDSEFFKDIAFLYNENENIIGHMYFAVTIKKVVTLSEYRTYSINIYDSYFPDYIYETEKKYLISTFAYKRIKNDPKLECDIFIDEQKVKKLS